MRNYEILWKLMRLYETNEVSWNFLGIILCFCSVVTYFVDFRFHFPCFRKLTTKFHFRVERFEILKFWTWPIVSNTWPKQFINKGPWRFPDSVVGKLKKKKPDELAPRLFDKCQSAKWRLSIYLNWSWVIIKWLASFKSSLLQKSYLQRTQTLQVDQYEKYIQK